MGGGSAVVADGVDLGCHFLRSGAGCASVVEPSGFTVATAMGCSPGSVGVTEGEAAAFGCHFFLSGEGAVGMMGVTGREGISAGGGGAAGAGPMRGDLGVRGRGGYFCGSW